MNNYYIIIIFTVFSIHTRNGSTIGNPISGIPTFKYGRR